jgi:hypothetical protein
MLRAAEELAWVRDENLHVRLWTAPILSEWDLFALQPGAWLPSGFALADKSRSSEQRAVAANGGRCPRRSLQEMPKLHTSGSLQLDDSAE